MMAVFFPVMYCQLIERIVGFLVLTAIKLAPVLVLLVMFKQVIHKFLVAHLFLAFVNFRTCCSFAFESSEFQVPSGLFDCFFILICVHKVLSTLPRASLVVIIIKQGSAGAANWIETFLAVSWLVDHIQAIRTCDQILVSYIFVFERKWNIRK